jgi:sulfate transport system substrate-binding protein
VIPETTLKIENPAALLIKHTPAAEPWIKFVVSDEGQRQFALKGFRPLGDRTLDDLGLKPSDIKGAPNPKDPFPKVDHLLTIDKDFGGWAGVKDKLFGDGKDGAPVGIVTKSIEKSGKATA